MTAAFYIGKERGIRTSKGQVCWQHYRLGSSTGAASGQFVFRKFFSLSFFLQTRVVLTLIPRLYSRADTPDTTPSAGSVPLSGLLVFLIG